MKRKLFGTDGIRGRANEFPITAETILQIGVAAGQYFHRDASNRHRVVIGKDTRRSGYMLENALTAGLTSAGMNVLLLGPVPTPAVGLLTRSMRADLGIMISASHNPHYDNGIKFFGPDGFKLRDEAETEIESLISRESELPPVSRIGSAKRIEDGLGRYVEYAKTTFPKHLRLNGLRVVIDCANGAAYRAAPEVFWELGAEVVSIGVSPNGFNINQQCGSTNVRQAVQKLHETRADVGICLDGDADRVIVVDQDGHVADGDQLLALFAQRWEEAGRLAKSTLVTTVMSNIGMENYLKSRGVALKRTAVGDRYVVGAMREHGYNLGGEASGHVIMSDYTTTGDGLIAALQFLAVMVETGKPASELARVFCAVPQKIENVRYRPGEDPLSHKLVKEAILDAENQLNGQGRVLVRKSGTEPIIRIMAECEDVSVLSKVVQDISSSIKSVY